MAKDIFDHKGFRSRFVLYSAYHKNLRLTTTSRATEWLQVLLKVSRPESIKKYLLKIALEETRSIELLKKLQKPNLDIQELTHEFVTVKKKWHHKLLQGSLINNWYNSYKYTLEQIKLGKRPLNVNSEDLKSNYLYNHYWYYKLAQLDDSEFWFSASNIDNPELKEFLSVRPEGSYSRMFCADLISGLGPLEEKCVIDVRKKSDVLKVPHFEDYIFDVHTPRGKKLIRENKALILRNEHKVPNLTMSGQVLSVLYRIETVVQFGDLTDPVGKVRSWSDTKLQNDEVSKALALDAFYYPSVYSNL